MIINFLQRCIMSIKSRTKFFLHDLFSLKHYYRQAERTLSIKENAILFESFGGNYFVGDPFYIYKEILDDGRFSNFVFYISANDVLETKRFLELKRLLDQRTIIVKKGSKQYIQILESAKYLINNMSFNINFIKRPEQVYMIIPHGKGYKKDGKYTVGDRFYFGNQQRTDLQMTFKLISSDLLEEIRKGNTLPWGLIEPKLVRSGLPRNTILCNKKIIAEISQYTKKDKPRIIYMPTWRQNSTNAVVSKGLYYGDRLAEHYLGQYDVYVKLHQAEMQLNNYVPRYAHVIPKDLEPYEILATADILITDYSSVFLDYINTRGRVILFQYDLDEYYQNRGVYDSIRNLMVYPIVTDEKMLWNEIDNHSQPDDETLYEALCKYDSPQSTNMAIETLLNKKSYTTPILNFVIISQDITDTELKRIKDSISDKNLLFVFLLGLRNEKYNSFNDIEAIDYIPINWRSNLTISERFHILLANTLKSNTPSTLIDYSIKIKDRECRRLFGDYTIGKIYVPKGQSRIPDWLRPCSEIIFV